MIVEELLRACGNQVYRFGYESILQNLGQNGSRFDPQSSLAADDNEIRNRGNRSSLKTNFAPISPGYSKPFAQTAQTVLGGQPDFSHDYQTVFQSRGTRSCSSRMSFPLIRWRPIQI